MVCKPDGDACHPYVMIPCCHVLAWGQVKLAHLYQLIASSFSTTTQSDIYNCNSEADLLTLYTGSTVVEMSNAVTVQKHSNASSHLGVDVCPATNVLHHSFASRMHSQQLPSLFTLRHGRRAVVLLTLMVQLRGQYNLKKMIQSFNLHFRYA